MGTVAGRRLVSGVLAKRTDRDALIQAEIDWPDSRGLLERVALGLRGLYADDAVLRARVASAAAGALAAYRAARKARLSEPERFAAFVRGMGSALDVRETPVLVRAMTGAQRRLLGHGPHLGPGGEGSDARG